MSADSQINILLSALIRVRDKCGAMHARIEDLMFRAQRIAGAMKMNRVVMDRFFGADLGIFREDLRKFRLELEEIGILVSSLKPLVSGDGREDGFEQLSASVVTLHGQLNGVAEYVLLAHQRMPLPEQRIEAWYCTREADEMIDWSVKMSEAVKTKRHGAA